MRTARRWELPVDGFAAEMIGSGTDGYRRNSQPDENYFAACLLFRTIVTALTARVQPKVSNALSYG